MIVLQLYGLMSLFGLFSMTLFHQGDVLLFVARESIPTLSQHRWRQARPTLESSKRYVATLDASDIIPLHRDPLALQPQKPLLLDPPPEPNVTSVDALFLDPFDGLPFWRLPLDYVLFSRELRREARIFVLTCIYWALAFGIYMITQLKGGPGEDKVAPDQPLPILLTTKVVNDAVLSLALNTKTSDATNLPGCSVETPSHPGQLPFFESRSTPTRSDISILSPRPTEASFMEFDLTDEVPPPKTCEGTQIPPGGSGPQAFPPSLPIAGGIYRRTRIQTTEGVFDATEWSFWTVPDAENAPPNDTSRCSDKVGTESLCSSPSLLGDPPSEEPPTETQNVPEVPVLVAALSINLDSAPTTLPEYSDEDDGEASFVDLSDLPPVTPAVPQYQPTVAFASTPVLPHIDELSSSRSATRLLKLKTHGRTDLVETEVDDDAARVADMPSEEHDGAYQGSPPGETHLQLRPAIQPDPELPSNTIEDGLETQLASEELQDVPSPSRAQTFNPYGPTIVSLPSDIWSDEFEGFTYASENEITTMESDAYRFLPISTSMPSALRQTTRVIQTSPSLPSALQQTRPDTEIEEMEQVEQMLEEADSQGDVEEFVQFTPEEFDVCPREEVSSVCIGAEGENFFQPDCPSNDHEFPMADQTPSQPIPIPNLNRPQGSGDLDTCGRSPLSDISKPRVIGRWTRQLAKSLEEKATLDAEREASSVVDKGDAGPSRKAVFSDIPNWREMPDDADTYLKPPSNSTWQRGGSGRSRSPEGPSRTCTWKPRARSASGGSNWQTQTKVTSWADD